MITIKNLLTEMKVKFPDITFYNGCIDKGTNCVGVYARGNAIPPVSVGVPSSYGILPVTMLIHWNENSNDCEVTANTLYEGLQQGIASINNKRVIDIQMIDSSPVNIGRDDNNRAEMTIRFNIIYER